MFEKPFKANKAFLIDFDHFKSDSKRECLGPLKSYFQQPYQVWWQRIKRMLSSGSGKKRGLHFNLWYR